MRYVVFAILFVSVSVSVIDAASADDSARPAFALMDNTGDGSKLDFDVSKAFHSEQVQIDPSLRFGLLGQYVAASGFGGYVGASVFKTMSDDGHGAGRFGDLELGGLYHYALSRDMDLGIRLGLDLPLTSDRAIGPLLATVLERPADVVTAVPDTTWLRLGISPTYHGGLLFLRTDLGVDVPIGDSRASDPVVHTNFGVGIENHGATATVELQNVFETGDQFAALQSVGLSMRYQGKWISPYVSASTPLNGGIFGEIVTISAGVTVPF
jgi:hypothetical protein